MATITDNRVYNVELAPAAYNASAPDILAALRTTEAITLTVDYATGSVPPLGTLVHNQAEATALGVLKTCADVIGVLPPYRDYDVNVNVLAGNQYAPNDSSYMFLIVPPTFSSPRKYQDSGFAKVFGPKITFIGARSVVYSGIAGTTANDPTMRRYKFTRSVGTWTVDELKGKFITIQSGAGAGSFLACMGNSTTEAYFQYSVSLGACSVNIEESATTLLTDSNGGSFVSQGISNLNNDGLASPIIVNWCNMGSNALPWKPGQSYQGFLQYNYCNITGGAAYLRSELGAYFNMQHCVCNFKPSVFANLYVGQKGSSLELIGNLFFGTPTSSFPHMIYMDDEACMNYCSYNRVMPDAGFTGAAFYAQYNVKFYAYGTYGLEVFCADQLCTGIRFEWGKSVFKGCNRITLNNCLAAVAVTEADVMFNTPFIASVSGTNIYGWKLNSGRASIPVPGPSTIAATNPIYIVNTGKIYPYELLVNTGDEIRSTAGDSITVI